MSNSIFRYGATEKAAGTPLNGDPWKTPMPTFWAVEEPHIVNDAIPRDLRSAGTKSSSTPTAAKLNLFQTEEAAIQFAQRMNRPLVIMEISTVSKIVPQLPRVEKYVPPKEKTQLTVAKITETTEFTNKG